MNCSKSLPALLAAAICFGAATDAAAQARGGHGRAPSGGGVAVGRAVPRPVYGGGRVYGPSRVYGRPIYGYPRVVGYAPYRPYYYPYRAGVTVGFYASFGYPYYGGYVGVGYPYYGGYYGYPYAAYGYPYTAYGYPYRYGYGPYGYPLPPPAYVSARPGIVYGGVQIEGAPPDAQVFADGYYIGIVDDFDGIGQHMNLEAGPHKIEIRIQGQQPIAFDVNVQPGQTTTFHAGLIR